MPSNTMSPLDAAVPGRDAMRTRPGYGRNYGLDPPDTGGVGLGGRGGGLYSMPGDSALGGSPYSFSTNRNSPTYASDTLGVITRDQYSDYLRNFYGVEQRLLDYATDAGLPAADAMKAAGQVGASFDRLPGQIERRQRRMGVSLDADQQAELDRQADLAEGRATGMAANRAASRTYDRQNAVLAGNQSAATDVIRGLEASP